MTPGSTPGLVFLHALPLDGSMWAEQANILPGQTYMPTLYSLGDTVQSWAAAVLDDVKEERLIVVGCSVGGSCALEIAAAAPERVAALVLIGTKARHDPDPDLHLSALELIATEGLEAAWATFWAPLFSKTASASVLEYARQLFLRQSAKDLATGITAFHTRPSRGGTLSGFDGTVAVVCGEEDIAPGPDVSAKQARSTRNGRLITIPDCGHYMPLEKPGCLNQILLEILVAHGVQI